VHAAGKRRTVGCACGVCLWAVPVGCACGVCLWGPLVVSRVVLLLTRPLMLAPAKVSIPPGTPTLKEIMDAAGAEANKLVATALSEFKESLAGFASYCGSKVLD